jgi:hypothetical protein
MARSVDIIKAEIVDLERIRAKRAGKPGFSTNVAEIDARLAAAREELAEAS